MLTQIDRRTWRRTEAELAFWPVVITSYQVQDHWECAIEAQRVGTTIARSSGRSRELAIEQARQTAEERLSRQRIFAH
ncbi:hypothetical protein SAMN07250955_104165 [Arboricoccus pini]|uniref:DRBM domain-containing protein n=1 Tax=Arboricoccus pini TaxID=1963835 RepID=A0A212QYY8_9PROT|nr:hypothetical protein [Arboricoccus pini]SNB64930.1 hypothetical protein SAMN07250955_104165 [Arboricoccus pini]